MNHSVIRPHIPYRGPTVGGIHVGKRIKIRGLVPIGADRFTVNLQTALSSDSDQPLHISVRFNGNIAVRNTRQNGSWGPEERSGPFPFAVGQMFTMGIYVDHGAYKISVNGQHYWDYCHRIPFSRVCSIMIDGDVTIKRIEFINSQPAPVPATCTPSVYTPATVCPAVTSIVSNIFGFHSPPLSCTFPIYGGVRPGMTIQISAKPTDSPQKFTINLQNGASAFPPPDIALHFDARFFNYTIVRNCRINNAWGSEETMISQFPFQPGMNFDMIIQVQSDVYLIILNGQQFISFRHRLNELPRFDVLHIENDVIVHSIRYY